MHRRSFLASGLAGLAAPALRAIQPIRRSGPPRLRLGCAAYSFREYFPYMRDKVVTPKPGHEPMDMFRFIDFCATNGCEGAELTAYFFPPNVTTDHLVKVRDHAKQRGIAVSGTAIGNVWTHPKGSAERDKEIASTKLWIDHAATLGAPHVRVFAGAAPKGVSFDEATANCIEAYRECAAYAEKKNILLGMENHGGIVAEPDNLLKIVRAVDSPMAGINFDSGNYQTEDPYADLAKIAPYAVNVQVKTEIKRKGGQNEPSDIPRVIKILRDVNYQGWFTLEYEAKGDPFVEVPGILRKLRELLA